MPTRFLRKKAVGHILLNLMLVLTLLLSTSTSVLAANVNVLPEIRTLLQNLYVDPVSAEVLNAPTVDETLERLGDPHTMYFSPEEYQEFLGSIDMHFTGIGIHINMEEDGVRVVSVISGSPAEEAGLKAGDLIVRAAGKSLAGLSSNEAVNILRGLEGSTVQISVQQGIVTKKLSVERREISEPTVTGDVLDGHIGYLDLNSFGSDTATEFEMVVNRIRGQNVDSWIVDLRDNGGGYLSSAFDLAGYFIGPNDIVSIKDRTGTVKQYKAQDHGFILNQPVIFLTNENSASASELLAAAVKDHQKGKLVGTTTYGKGTVQSMFTLANKGVLKMTIDRFYSPFGHEINKVGVTPDVEIKQADSLKAAELMLSDATEALVKGRTTAYWEAWGELANSVNSLPTDQPSDRYARYYPSYLKVSELSSIPLDKKFTVLFNGAVDWQSVNSTSLELIDSATGERIPTKIETLGISEAQVIPNVALNPNTTYWLIIHPTIHDVKGVGMTEGAVAVAHTIEGTEGAGTSKIQSIEIQGKASNSHLTGLRDPDYGWALWDLEEKVKGN
ncbi:S41 family peptidase [Desulfosporosinus fructosivorans]|uniref:S41 family peptidase n=1 Tax=Desulfosporosinus fructosivorans TaxID=2018669 RepID=A0A4Z0RBE5_9FIRM|nr:S41 family peptidase [Desulfosporosinus fructosivorans]TGE39579.1 S41 family peptidase [Desulfosporosinus fructosivorans]